MAESDPPKEIEEPYELPEGWIWCTLEEVFFEIMNGTTEAQNVDGVGFPVTRIETIQKGEFDMFRVKFIDSTSQEFLDKYKYRVGDIALSHINSKEHVGKTAIYLGHPEALIHGMNLLRLRFGHTNGFPQFFYWYFQSEKFRNDIRGRVKHAVNQVSINQKNLSQIILPLPPLPEQHRIVTKLEALLAQVNRSKDHLAKVPLLIKRFRQSVLAAACSGRLTEDWRREHPDVEPASELLNRIREERIRRYDEECRKAEAEGRRKPKKPKNLELEGVDTEGLPELPEGWVWTSLYTLSYLITKGATPTSYGFNYVDKGINFIKVENIAKANIRSNSLQHITMEAHEFLKRSQLQEKDILFSIAGTIGRSAIVRKHHLPANTNQALAIIRLPYTFVSIDYIQLSLANHITILNAQNKMRGVGMNNISLGDVNNIIVSLSPLPEQHTIVKNVGNLFHFADEVEQRVTAATTHANHLTQSILARAFRGELVPQDPNDEPASVLLERIKQERAELKAKKKTQKRKSKTLLDFN